MKYFVKIDRKNIRLKKAYDYVVGKQTKEEQKVHHISGNLYQVEKWFNDVKVSVDIKQCKVPPESRTEITWPCQKLYNITGSRYSFSYVPTDVKCVKCSNEFDFSLLRNYCDDWDCGSSVEYTSVCPYCKQCRCCEVEYEKLTDEEFEKWSMIGTNQVVIE